MGKYASGFIPKIGTGIVASACAQVAEGGAHAYDLWVDECQSVVGNHIEIGDKALTIQAGFEVTNVNFGQDQTAAAVPSQFGLPGGVA
jgi:hypothetical protein